MLPPYVVVWASVCAHNKVVGYSFVYIIVDLIEFTEKEVGASLFEAK